MQGLVRLYACGGAGINIAKSMIANELLSIVFVDSSTSNLSNIMGSHETYLVEGMDGAGKLRTTTYEAFKLDAENVLINHPPLPTLNIVLSSLSGGTGSVIAPLITRELLGRNETTIVIGVGSDESFRELENTVKTLLTYNNFSLKANKPIAMYYEEPRERAKVDNCVKGVIDLFTVIVDSKNTEEFDTADLRNFVNYDLVTNIPAGLSLIVPHYNDEEVNEDNVNKQNRDVYIASSILVTKDVSATVKNVKPEYLAKVIVTKQDYDKKDSRIDNVVGSFAIKLNDLQDQMKKHQEGVKVNKINRIEQVSSNNDDDMVL